MRLLLIGFAIVLFTLTTACSELALTKPPEEASDVPASQEQGHQEQAAQPEAAQPEETEPTESQPEERGSGETESPEAESGPSAQMVEDIKSILSAKTGVPSHELMFVSAEPVDWPDACLGVHTSEELCAQVITPGYRIIFSNLEQQYEVHTDRSGRNIRISDEG